MHPEEIHRVIELLRTEYPKWRRPSVTTIAETGRSPFKVLVSCIISLRTKDETTSEASARLFALADSPHAMSNLSPEQIATAIYPAGFYRNKASQILDISRRLVAECNGKVPDSLDALLSFRGVGRKTANLVVTLGFGKPGICVDVHVHRICNRWGYVVTKTPDETELALRRILPDPYWLEINDLLVVFGQNLCRPVSPHCSTCPLANYCARIGVISSR